MAILTFRGFLESSTHSVPLIFTIICFFFQYVVNKRCFALSFKIWYMAGYRGVSGCCGIRLSTAVGGIWQCSFSLAVSHSAIVGDHRHHSYCRAPLPVRRCGKVADLAFSLNTLMSNCHQRARSMRSCETFQRSPLMTEDVTMFFWPCLYVLWDSLAWHMKSWNTPLQQNVPIPSPNLQIPTSS